ncbi:hypothetical protein D4764_13G0001690 [Takifugu flavidus]|uniref:Uncharacterized protein n=1 Tax=Takifugu flavidus TaxID=433684 RepID=A0A5C6PBJ2_9TELE|nr:hypothetical protein D4764_13G0001690 [Takifugu flavidus]
MNESPPNAPLIGPSQPDARVAAQPGGDPHVVRSSSSIPLTHADQPERGGGGVNKNWNAQTGVACREDTGRDVRSFLTEPRLLLSPLPSRGRATLQGPVRLHGETPNPAVSWWRGDSRGDGCGFAGITMLDGLRRRHASRPSSRPLSLNFSTFSAPPHSPDMEGSREHPIRR